MNQPPPKKCIPPTPEVKNILTSPKNPKFQFPLTLAGGVHYDNWKQKTYEYLGISDQTPKNRNMNHPFLGGLYVHQQEKSLASSLCE